MGGMTQTMLTGDAKTVLAGLPDRTFDCCVTSPPYYQLRDYQIDGQIGLEKTPDEFINKLVGVFREVRRVLTDDGTCWIVIGDSYWGDSPPRRASSDAFSKSWNPSDSAGAGLWVEAYRRPGDLKRKDLIGIPWMLAFALRADGWYLRQDVIWAKPNPMPSSVTDRCTTSHEHVFLLTKSAKYHYDAAAIREPSITNDPRRPYMSKGAKDMDGRLEWKSGQRRDGSDFSSRNKRDVWTVNTKPFKGAAHFATFPPDLIEPCILAGSRVGGKRCDCGEIIATPTGVMVRDDPSIVTGRAGFNRERGAEEGVRPITRREQRGYAEQMRASPYRQQIAKVCGSAFDHYIRQDGSGARPLPKGILEDFRRLGWLVDVPPCNCPTYPAGTVLDPFAGTGTVGLVCHRHGRGFVGIDLDPRSEGFLADRIAKNK